MRPEQRDPACLWDMLEAGKDVVRYLGDLSLAQFLADEKDMTRLAIERKLEILGEAARRISESFQQAHPEIPWTDIIGLRNVISHQYDKVDYEEIFRIVRQRVPDLIALLEPLVPSLPPEDAS